MKRAFEGFALVAVGALGIIALRAAAELNQPEPARSEAVRATESHFPLLLDPSWKTKPTGGNDDAREPKDLAIPAPGNLRVSMDILVDGRSLRTVRHAGRTYLPVPQVGAEYEIRVWNHGPRRVAAVLSVDGLSVITGQPASEHDPGYLIAPYNSIVVKGWRRNLERVAAFRFVDRDESYARLVGKPENIGVIGLVAIEERIVYPLPQLERKEATRVADGFRTEVGSIGTEYGRGIDSHAYYVPFLRSNNKQTMTLYYDSVKALRAAGVPVDRPLPNPILEFAPPPPGYRGK